MHCCSRKLLLCVACSWAEAQLRQLVNQALRQLGLLM
jgi:hypothetical protein